MLASALITRSLRLINVPGRGAPLLTGDQSAAFDALQDLLNSKAVSKQYVPGIVRHVFAMISDQHIYSYGPGGELDTDDYEDPVPNRVEDAYINTGGTIVNNEKVGNDKFSDNTVWTLGAGWTIQNGFAQCAAGLGVLSQTISGLTIGVVYDVKIVVGSVSLADADLTISVINENIGSAGTFEFTFTATATSHLLSLTPTAAFTTQIDSVSVRQVNTLRTTFTHEGSDYPVRAFDQRSYNRQYTKGSGGRPYELLFSKNYPLAELRFDNAPSSGDNLVMDVQVNRIGVTSLNDTIQMHDEAIRWVRYALANELAPEFGKELKPSAVRNMKDARSDLAASNHRINNLRMDRGLRTSRTFDINRGDP